VTKSCFLCGKKLGFWTDTFGKYALSQEEFSIPKGFGDEDVICFDCLQVAKVNLERPEPEPRKKESKPHRRLDMGEKLSPAWYLAPIVMGIIGSAIMWYVLKDEDHPDSPKMIEKGWVIGGVLTLIAIVASVISFALNPSS